MRQREGARVAWAGPERERPMGTEGKVVSAADESCHVRWSDGEITLCSNLDVVPTSRSHDDGFDGSLVSFSVRQTYAKEGAFGVVLGLDSEGHLAQMAAVAEDTVARMTASVRNDPSIAEALSDLDEEETERVVSTLTSVLLSEALEATEDAGGA